MAFELRQSKALHVTAIQSLILFAISCGVNTIYYLREKFIGMAHAMWQKYLLFSTLVMVFLSGFFLNFILYMRNINDFFSNNNKPKSYSSLVKLTGIGLAFLAALATGIFSYYSCVNLSLALHPFIIWSLVFASAIVTFALLAEDTMDLIQNIFMLKPSFKNFNRKKALLSIIFVFGTAGLLKTNYVAFTTLGLSSFSLVLALALAVSEIAFVISTASEIIDNGAKLTLNKKNMLFISICLLPAIFNGFANGILDAASLTGNLGLSMAICGTILSVCLMMNSICSQSNDNDKLSFSKLFASIKGMIANKQQAYSSATFSSALIATILMFQFHIPHPGIWLPVMLLINLLASRTYVYFSNVNNTNKSLAKVFPEIFLGADPAHNSEGNGRDCHVQQGPSNH